MIAVSYLKSLDDKEETIRKIEKSEADFLHVDVMDGKYVKARNYDVDTLVHDLRYVSKKVDVHLMVDHPLNYISSLISLNVFLVTFHLGIKDNIEEVIKTLKKSKSLVGIAVNPDEDIHLIDKYLKDIDYCLVLGVTPGEGGQKFNPEVIEKIKYLQDKGVAIGLDGGVNDEILPMLKGLKVAILVSGSYVCMSPNYNEKIRSLKKFFK